MKQNEQANGLIKPSLERNILTLCLRSEDVFAHIKNNQIKAHMFLIEANQYIFEAIDYLFTKQQVATPEAIYEVISNSNKKKIIEDYGGIEYLNILTTSLVNEGNIDIFCEKLKQTYTRHTLLHIFAKQHNEIISDNCEVLNTTEIIASIEKEIYALHSETLQTNQIYKMGSDIEQVLELRSKTPNEVPGLKVGMPMFDYYTNGGLPGDLIMVCARAKTGKSTLLTNWAKELAIIQKRPVLYFDTEMNAREQEDRLVSMLSGVPHREILAGTFVLDTVHGKAADKQKRINEAIEQIKEGNYYHIYLPNFTIDKINAIAKKFKSQVNIEAIFFDYLKFPASSVGSLRNASEWQMLGFIASGLKDLAGILEVPIYSAAQENRSNLDGKKDERNVGGSDRILQLASKLLFLSNKKEGDIIADGKLSGNQVINITFQRNGESDCPPIDLFFDHAICRQTEI